MKNNQRFEQVFHKSTCTNHQRAHGKMVNVINHQGNVKLTNKQKTQLSTTTQPTELLKSKSMTFPSIFKDMKQ